jgi:hypothetical protein
MNRTPGTQLLLVCIAAVLLLFANIAQAGPFTLTNAPGDGTVTVGVDGFGAFGSFVGADSTDAFFTPVGAAVAAPTTFDSGVAIRIGAAGARSFLTSGDIGGSGGLANPAVAGTPTSATSAFTFGDLSFSLTQTLTPLFTGPSQTGSLLTQTYVITNTSGLPIDFELVRYLVGDLGFVGDGGGRLVSGSTELLFETDTATDTATSTIFVAIAAEGGTIPGTNRFEVDSFPGLRSRIITGTALDDIITGDGADPDQFIDAGGGYDVTLALRNLFTLSGGGTGTYTTLTIFGDGAPQDVVLQPVPEPSAWLTFATALLIGSSAVWMGKRRRAA